MTKTRKRTRRFKKEKGRILKQLISKSTGKTAGRNSAGRITSFHRGGGSKRLHRTLDLKRDVPATGVVERIEYDPTRSSRVALVRWIDGVNFLRRRSSQNSQRSDLDPSPQTKVLDSTTNVSSIFSFSTLPGGIERKKASFCSSQANCLPKNYVMIGESSPKGSTWSAPLTTRVEIAVSAPAPPSLGMKLPRIAVAGAKPSFFAPRKIGDEPIGENLSLAEIQRWKSKSIDRKVAIPWQSSGVDELRPKANLGGNLLPTQVISYALSVGGKKPSYQNALPVKTNVVKTMKDDRVPVSYIMASDKLEAGSTVMNCDWSKPTQSSGKSWHEDSHYERLELTSQAGNCIPLADIRMGTFVHDVEWHPGQGAKLVRAAGTSAKVIKVQGSQALLRLPSGAEKVVDARCRATVGTVSNPDHRAQKLRKAGQSRWLGRRPVVRGVAMNPVDHPHGGGEGRTSGGRPSVSPWGKPTKGGFKTVLKVLGKGKL